MDKNLAPKAVLIIALVALAGWTLYPPSKTLKPGLDLAGGTSLIYEIDTQGLGEGDEKGLSGRMIKVLRRRIDPDNIQNIVWRPHGNTRFEIQMPLASAETVLKRQNLDKAKTELLAKNISWASIIRSLQKPVEQRAEDFNDFAQDDPDRLKILQTLATTYDERKELQSKRDHLYKESKTAEGMMPLAGIDPNHVRENISQWITLNNSKLKESLKDFLGENPNLDMLEKYVKTYAEWGQAVEQLTDPETGKNVQYKNAERGISKLNLTEDQIDAVLEMPFKSIQRARVIEGLKSEFSDRAQEIDNVVAAYSEYHPFRGRLDDPQDLQQMLKGAGILEWRILPTLGHPEVDADAMAGYIEALREKGPKYASDDKYVWCEVENVEEWIGVDEQGRPIAKTVDADGRPAIVASFGNEYYVLTSNKKDQCMLHSTGDKGWQLIKAAPGTESRTGRRAIDFVLDERGGKLFGNVTGKNIDRPLCIMLDGLAISAPNILTTIRTHGQITGNFNEMEIRDMVDKLNAGSLPARLIEPPISEKTIGPSIGADNRDQGIRAGFIGLVVVISCMLIYYTLAGAIADMALLMNILFVLAIMALVRATFTLPGIAGIILTIGMSVDANVLIFERIREEQQRGSSLRIAIKNGYQRAFTAIFDANLTTFITAAILYGFASEEIKGFAIVLMLGIVSSMFTALFVTRVIFDFLLARRFIKDHLFMLSIIHKPNVNWMALRPVFFTISSVLIIAGLVVFFTRDDTKNNKYDIEFTGGTSAVVNLKDGVELTRQNVEDRIHEIGDKLNNPGIKAANIYSIGKPHKVTPDGQKFHKQYEINTTETNKTTAIVTFSQTGQQTIANLTSAIEKAQAQMGVGLNGLLVTQHSNPAAFAITTSQTNKALVKDVLSTAFPEAEVSEPEIDEVVNNAILTAFGDQLEIQQNLQPKITSQEKITEQLVDAYPKLADFVGGIKLKCSIERAATAEEIEQRFKNLRFKPDMRDLDWRHPSKILDAALNTMQPNQPIKSFVYLSVHPEAGFRALTEDEWSRFVENERTKVLAAARQETSLPRVTQIDPSVGSEAKHRALRAIVLSLLAIIIYIWVRFGTARYGFAAIAALVHDVCITLGAVTVCTYIAATPIGEKFLIGDFKISLAIIAAFLTLIGYSLNDTIVVFDRIRENRRKAQLNSQIITDSINQTISRTILTSFTTFIVVLIMYIFGGQALRGFTFAIGFGIIIGTYSSVAIAAPVLLLGTKSAETKKSA